MTSGTTILRRWSLASALLAATAIASPAPEARPPAADAEQLIARLARPAPATVRFAEARFSGLLREPLVVSGELSYSGPGNMDRHVREPYLEHTSIRGDSVRVQREGEPPRTFALKRAPELRGMLSGFTALLGGDAAALRKEFDMTLQSLPGVGDDGWKLTLMPRDARAQRNLQRIEVEGSGDEPRCFAVMSPRGGTSVMLLGKLAIEPLPAPLTLDALRAACSAR